MPLRNFGRKTERFFILFAFCFSSEALHASVVNITAEYKPGSYSDPRGEKFVNTTPCINATQTPLSPDFCNSKKVIDDFTSLSLYMRSDITSKETDDALMYLKTGGERTVVLTNSSNLEQHEVTLIPTHIGAKVSSIYFRLGFGDYDIYPFDRVTGDCKKSSYQSSAYIIIDGNTKHITEQNFMHEIKLSAQNRPAVCKIIPYTKKGQKYIIETINYGFKIKSPNPLSMSNGVYTGSLKLFSGKNQDIEVGPSIDGTVLNLTFLFTLIVSHQLKIDFPTSGSEQKSQVTLLPVGGWQQSRRKFPIERRLPLRISHSSPYTVSLICQYKKDNMCALNNSKGHSVRLNTTYIDVRNNRRLLYFNYPTRITMTDYKPVIDEAAFILFKVEPEQVAEMLNFPGSTYKGDVTFVFDSSL